MKKISINARIKELRATLRYKQAEFGEQIGVKDGAVWRMEQEGSSVAEQSIMLICQKFRVRREWLVDGEGEMFVSGEPGIFSEFAKEYKLTSQEQEVAKYLLNLSEGERASILSHLRSIADAMERGKQADAKAAEYHRQLDEALADEKEAAAASSFSGSAKRA